MLKESRATGHVQMGESCACARGPHLLLVGSPLAWLGAFHPLQSSFSLWLGPCICHFLAIVHGLTDDTLCWGQRSPRLQWQLFSSALCSAVGSERAALCLAGGAWLAAPQVAWQAFVPFSSFGCWDWHMSSKVFPLWPSEHTLNLLMSL